MKTNSKHICKCVKTISVKIDRTVVDVFVEGKKYGAVLYQNEYRIYGDEWIYHINVNKFEDNFKIIKSHKGGYYFKSN